MLSSSSKFPFTSALGGETSLRYGEIWKQKQGLVIKIKHQPCHRQDAIADVIPRAAGGAVLNTPGNPALSNETLSRNKPKRIYKGPTLEAAGVFVPCGQRRIVITRRVGALIVLGPRGKSAEITADN